MWLWTFPYRSIPAPQGDVLAKAHFDLAVFLEETEPDEVLWSSLGGRRRALQQYELESYAAIGGLVVKAIHGGARGCVLNDGGQGGFMGWVTVDFPMYLVGKS